MYVLVIIAVVLVFMLLFAAGVRFIVRRAQARGGNPQGAGGSEPGSGDGRDRGSDAQGAAAGRTWRRVIERPDGRIEIRAGTSAGRDEAGHVVYAIDMQGTAYGGDGTRRVEAVVEDWIADEVVASPEGDLLVFVRDYEEDSDDSTTRAHIVELDQGRVLCSLECPGRRRDLSFDAARGGRRITLKTDRDTRSVELPIV